MTTITATPQAERALAREELDVLERLALRQFALEGSVGALFDARFVRDRRIEFKGVGDEIGTVRDRLRTAAGLPALRTFASHAAKQAAGDAWQIEYDTVRAELRERYGASV